MFRSARSGLTLHASHLVISQNLQSADHGGMIPGRTAMRYAGVEQFLARRGVRQRKPKLTRAGERKVEVLLVKGNTETRIEGALDHALAEHFEDSRSGEPPHQRLPHFGRIGARLRGEKKPFRDCSDGPGDNNLLGDLVRLPVPVLSDALDVLAHQLNQSLEALQCSLLPP